MSEPHRCTATTAKGRPCKAWAVQGTSPPRCASHGGARGVPGALPGHTNAQTRGAYSSSQAGEGLNGQILDLDTRIARLGAYIDNHHADLETDDWLKLLDLHSKLIGRVTRVRKTRQQLQGDDDQLSAAINAALDSLSEEWGIQL